jgi:hypothetical protein
MWSWIARIFAFVVGALMLSFSLPVLFRPAPEGLPRGAHLPGISLELALDPGEAVHFINLQRGARYVLASLDFDDHAVIPIYVALLVVLGIWLFGRSVPFARVLGVLVIGATLLAGYSDRRENQGIRSIVAQYQNDPSQIQQDTVDHMRGWSILKWGLLATAMAVLSVPFFARRRSLPIAVLYLLCALTYTVGLVGHRAGFAGFVEWGFFLMGLAWLLTFVGIGAVSNYGHAGIALHRHSLDIRSDVD